MRLLTLLLVAGCPMLRDLTPTGPVLSYAERADLGADVPSGVTYGPAPDIGLPPIPPVHIWGLTYDIDLVFRTHHPDWDMHEYVRITTPDGPVWLAKDARSPSKEQGIVGDLDDIDAWLPEVPVPRKHFGMEIDDRSTTTDVDLRLAYENLDGERVEVSYRGTRPERLQSDRNGNTMGHSAGTVMVALDLSRMAFGEGSLSIGGEPQRIVKVAGLVPLRVALVQTQAGFAVGRAAYRSELDGVRSDTNGIPLSWSRQELPGGVELVQHQPLRTIRHRFLRRGRGDAPEELVASRIDQFGQAASTAYVRFYPALPDVRRPFRGTFEGHWVLDVNGQPAHARGTTKLWWDQGEAFLELRGEAPPWIADRPLRSTITRKGDEVLVEVVRIP